MAKLIVGIKEYTLPDDADIDQITVAITDAMSEGRGVAVSVRGDEGEDLLLILNCALLPTVEIDTSGGGWIKSPVGGGRISGK
jgi:hypothetical protein